MRLNNTPRAEREFVLYNRIEKTGSQSMTILIKQLGEQNGFGSFRNVITPKSDMVQTFTEEREFVHQLMELAEPSAYVEHSNWVNFTAHDMPRPIYMNLVRHPIQKVISSYYYLRHPKIVAHTMRRRRNKKIPDKEYFDMTFNDCVRQRIAPHCVFDAHNRFNGDWRRFNLHLCGNAAICKQLNSEETMQMAKRNVEREYAVVGTWEQTNITLAVLEAYIPRYFAGAAKIYYSQTKTFKINSTPHDNNLDEDVERYLKDSLKFELELYQFIMQRLYMQYIAINKQRFVDIHI
ncbi:heparan sulfate 2-O-sulfotransferase pipe-like [Drosophila obscura]|uniref:heparan sulfate 2-O-sulfotransferase pipe-like n=1 Tax=Drosophila obscura TaxID=7282 RepID=UPI001BB19556|nr:heparan sulfate 2-O-sulfotransferase pipe-like [Drosophila obscura]